MLLCSFVLQGHCGQPRQLHQGGHRPGDPGTPRLTTRCCLPWPVWMPCTSQQQASLPHPSPHIYTLSLSHARARLQLHTQFQSLRRVFQAHSKAEDDLIWPALREKAWRDGVARESLECALEEDHSDEECACGCVVVGWECTVLPAGLPALLTRAVARADVIERLIGIGFLPLSARLARQTSSPRLRHCSRCSRRAAPRREPRLPRR